MLGFSATEAHVPQVAYVLGKSKVHDKRRLPYGLNEEAKDKHVHGNQRYVENK